MKDADLRAEVEGLMSAGPLPATELGRLDRSWLPALAWGARHHPSPRMRRLCLDYLDHVAVPASADVFIAALEDPVPRVGRHAIHALTCQACKDGPWRVDAISPLQRVLAADDNPKVRFEALRALLSRVDPATAQQILDNVPVRGDRDLAAAAARQRPASVPATLWAWARQTLAS